jgi:hypothetical protein
MKQGFLFIYFVLYIVALVSLLPAAGGGRIPCNQLADSLAAVFSQPVSLDVPHTVRLQIARLTMGDRVLDTRSVSTEIRVYLSGVTLEEERKGVVYQIAALDGAPDLHCVTDSVTGVGVISQTFSRTGRYRYTITGKFRRLVPAQIPQCVRELLHHLNGLELEARQDFEIIVEASDFRTPC